MYPSYLTTHSYEKKHNNTNNTNHTSVNINTTSLTHTHPNKILGHVEEVVNG